MISLLVGAVIASFRQPNLDPPVMLAAAMVRHQEPVKTGGIRATVAEIYPIVWENGGKWTDASAYRSEKPQIQAGDRFSIFQNAWRVGWLDVNRIAPKPYLDDEVWVGLGGWSLPRALYPYRLVRSRNLNYLAYSAYDWGNDTYQNSIQPFLALNVDRQGLAPSALLPSQVHKYVEPVVQRQAERILKWSNYDPKYAQFLSLKTFDLQDDRIPEAVAVYGLPDDRYFLLVGTVEGDQFKELYRQFSNGVDWEPLDALDVDGDGYKEIVLTGRGEGSLSFEVLQRKDAKLAKVFEGAGFRKASAG